MTAVECGPVHVRIEDGKVAEVRPVEGWPPIPCAGVVDLKWGQYGPREVIQTGAGPTSPDHSGTDISLWWGDPVRSVAPGEVVFSGYDGAKAQVVIIRHKDGTGSGYVHMAGWMAPVGKWVERGEVIGFGGSTGQSTGVHLHFMRMRKVPVPYPTEYYWFPREDLIDPFGEESNFMEELSHEAQNEQPTPDFLLGPWPKPGSSSLMVVNQRPADLGELWVEAGRAGVDISSIHALKNGKWYGYWLEAPTQANAAFRDNIDVQSGTALYVTRY